MNKNQPGAVLPKIIHWSPNPIRIQLAAIRLTAGQQMDSDIYMSLLADRVDWMVQQAGEPKEVMKELLDQMINWGLASYYAQADKSIIYSNLELMERLYELNVLPAGKQIIETNDLQAEEAFQATTLWEWLDKL